MIWKKSVIKSIIKSVMKVDYPYMTPALMSVLKDLTVLIVKYQKILSEETLRMGTTTRWLSQGGHLEQKTDK